MATVLPLRLLSLANGEFSVIDPRASMISEFDIVSYTWGDLVEPYMCGIPGVTWKIPLRPEKLAAIMRLLGSISSETRYLWCDCVCLNQDDMDEKAVEIPRMFDYYKSARKCHILLDIPLVWNPQEIVDNLKFLDHVLAHMGGAALASEARLTPNVINRLAQWAGRTDFPLEKSIMRSAAVDMGVLNCYAACIHHVKSLFDNDYFSRVWTFQEMILGKNIILWANNSERMDYIGQLETWMDLATDSRDKAHKLFRWIDECRVVNTGSVNAILRIIAEDELDLESLKTQVRGIGGARADIITGGAIWWQDNFKGIMNIFSAISLSPRKCREKADIFRGLLGIFCGLFSADEVKRDLSGEDLDMISFNFFKQLSHKTGVAWTKLAVSSRERGEWDWIPVVENHNDVMTTDCFAGVIELGRLKPKGLAKAIADTGIKGSPRTYMKLRLEKQEGPFQFYFKGCNCGKSVKKSFFKSEPIPTNDQPRDVVKDETGRVLVQSATILATLMSPGYDVVEYRRKLLKTFQPHWNVSDPSAKPPNWIDRCVSGTPWENPDLRFLRTHNMSMNYRMLDIDTASCGSRLANESTAKISCEVHINCGCIIIAPFPYIFQAISAVQGSFLGQLNASIDNDDRIILKDGVGLIQVGDVGKTFHLVAFSGDNDAHRSYASSCRSTKADKAVVPNQMPMWPTGRAFVREDFSHGLTDGLRDYGYVPTGGSGNLLICRNTPIDQYRVIGVCIDEYIHHEKQRREYSLGIAVYPYLNPNIDETMTGMLQCTHVYDNRLNQNYLVKANRPENLVIELRPLRTFWVRSELATGFGYISYCYSAKQIFFEGKASLVESRKDSILVPSSWNVQLIDPSSSSLTDRPQTNAVSYYRIRVFFVTTEMGQLDLPRSVTSVQAPAKSRSSYPHNQSTNRPEFRPEHALYTSELLSYRPSGSRLLPVPQSTAPALC
ncbi:hypothetical protein EJ05DRAFT_537160 [Pseudovirgaria hyperparasitica]|uniref:Heterokaryon incompatibility domain-containing protein n=1 Tax=Pseudovirgaria hyperparasitica TaxID=470096 RepID=A0A6A6WDQ3_9PEZI|nr:uncharacterized protein EJ05DRAFT_537160 [Pseudovirgaria hyperparasitica]KAF2759976.1 hypothetical protein EJ05DRAFT_537160 [Pseudovirgaria hyperparasitica]